MDAWVNSGCRRNDMKLISLIVSPFHMTQVYVNALRNFNS